MIDTDRAWMLVESWWLIRHRVGWLAALMRQFGMSTEEEEMLCSLDDAFIGVDHALVKWSASMAEADKFGLLNAETDQEIVDVLSRNIAEAYRAYENAARKDEPFIDRQLMLMLREIPRQEKLRRAARARILHAQRPVSADRITDLDIARARAYPLEKLIPDYDMAKSGYIRCRWHEDRRPSMLVKNGFGYCFSCHTTVDSIKWMMEIENYAFVGAVKRLCGVVG